jgi:phosphohistidine phosphatase
MSDMARQLWLLRHADAEPHGTRPDAQRRLTERGERQARVAGLALVRMGVEFEAVLSSPKARALRTAALVEEAWSAQPGRLEVHEPLAGGFDAGQALTALAGISADGRMLLVGHEPDLSGLVGDLTGGLVDLKKGGLAVVRLEGAGGALIALMRPRELALIAGDQLGD